MMSVGGTSATTAGARWDNFHVEVIQTDNGAEFREPFYWHILAQVRQKKIFS
jgi:hypothetical protein